MPIWLKRWLAFYRISQRYVCEMSTNDREYHVPEDESHLAPPMHFYEYTCLRCGKKFTI